MTTYKLFIPERGPRRPFHAIMPCPERLKVAWHRDAEGIHELLDENGWHPRLGTPQSSLWEVREYERVMHDPDAREAFYELAEPAKPC